MAFYIVTETIQHAENPKGDGTKKHLVEAKNQSAALKAVVSPRFTVEVASMKEAVELTEKGVKAIQG